MRDHHNLDVFLLVFVFLLPAQVLLLFAWFVSVANKQPVLAEWRRKTFGWGLFAATGVTAWFFAFCVHFVRVGVPAQRLWLVLGFLRFLLFVLWLSGFLCWVK